MSNKARVHLQMRVKAQNAYRKHSLFWSIDRQQSELSDTALEVLRVNVCNYLS
jgi:hypothetical protein